MTENRGGIRWIFPMTKKHNISLDHRNRLVKYKQIGLLTKDIVGKAWDDLLNMEVFTKKGYDLLTDYREGHNGIEFYEIELICQYLLQFQDILINKRQAILIHEPLGTSVSMIFEHMVKIIVGFEVKVFDDESKALDWLKSAHQSDQLI
jgi:hypothetical protein